jgi:hypothetical protein
MTKNMRSEWWRNPNESNKSNRSSHSNKSNKSNKSNDSTGSDDLRSTSPRASRSVYEQRRLTAGSMVTGDQSASLTETEAGPSLLSASTAGSRSTSF